MATALDAIGRRLTGDRLRSLVSRLTCSWRELLLREAPSGALERGRAAGRRSERSAALALPSILMNGE